MRCSLHFIGALLSIVLFVAAAFFAIAWKYDDDFLATIKNPPTLKTHIAEVKRLLAEYENQPDSMRSQYCRALFEARVVAEYRHGARPSAQTAERHRNL